MIKDKICGNCKYFRQSKGASCGVCVYFDPYELTYSQKDEFFCKGFTLKEEKESGTDRTE